MARHEERLREARYYARKLLPEAVTDLQLPPDPSEADIEAARDKVRDRVVLPTWEKFFPRKRKLKKLEAALWTEEFPSLQDLTMTAIQTAIRRGEPGDSRLANNPYRGVPPGSGPQGVGERSAGRPKLPAEALQNIIDAEKAATEELEKALAFSGPSNPKFVYHPVEINAGCWKVIEHLTTFAEAIFNAQAREYLKHYPTLVLGGDLLTAEVGPEVVRRTKLRWTKWETDVDWALRTRWSPEYYRAYVEEGNQPGSEDQKLMEHFLRRLDESVADRSNHWREQAEAVGHESPPTGAASVTIPGEAALAMHGSAVPGQLDATRLPEQNVQRAPSPVKDTQVALLEMILDKMPTTLEKWAKEHNLAGQPSLIGKQHGSPAGH